MHTAIAAAPLTPHEAKKTEQYSPEARAALIETLSRNLLGRMLEVPHTVSLDGGVAIKDKNDSGSSETSYRLGVGRAGVELTLDEVIPGNRPLEARYVHESTVVSKDGHVSTLRINKGPSIPTDRRQSSQQMNETEADSMILQLSSLEAAITKAETKHNIDKKA